MKPTARFFCENIPQVGEEAVLDRDESHHLAKVLRLEEGAVCDLIDGRGTLARALLTDASAREAKFTIDEHGKTAAQHHITVAFGVTKGAALDFIVHRLTEIGVEAMVPLLTDHSLAPKEWNEERWTRVLRETAKQCQETWFPKLYPPIALDRFLKGLAGGAFAVCDEAQRSGGLAGTRLNTVLVGPEGGWSELERGLFKDVGATFLGLGVNRLRAETAAVAAAVLLKQASGEL